MNNKYEEGEWVYEIANPSIDLLIRHRSNDRYYCHKKGESGEKVLVFFERMILPLQNRIATHEESTKPWDKD